jgi:hypothetical protein
MYVLDMPAGWARRSTRAIQTMLQRNMKAASPDASPGQNRRISAPSAFDFDINGTHPGIGR